MNQLIDRTTAHVIRLMRFVSKVEDADWETLRHGVEWVEHAGDVGGEGWWRGPTKAGTCPGCRRLRRWTSAALDLRQSQMAQTTVHIWRADYSLTAVWARGQNQPATSGISDATTTCSPRASAARRHVGCTCRRAAPMPWAAVPGQKPRAIQPVASGRCPAGRKRPCR